jgi:predicted transcriptional regulator
MPYVSRPMKLVTVWLTEEEKATLDRLAKEEDVTLSKAIREGLKLYFEDAKDWIEERQGESRAAKPA